MKIRLNLPDGERTFPIPSPMILQLLSNQIPNAPIRRYLQEPGRCQQLYTELERCAARFPSLEILHVHPTSGGDISVTLER